MKTPFFLILITVVLSVSCSQNEKETGQKGAPPNILFIFTDDHARQSISAYGSIINKTPNLDRLAKQGMMLYKCHGYQLHLRAESCGDINRKTQPHQWLYAK